MKGGRSVGGEAWHPTGASLDLLTRVFTASTRSALPLHEPRNWISSRGVESNRPRLATLGRSEAGKPKEMEFIKSSTASGL